MQYLQKYFTYGRPSLVSMLHINEASMPDARVVYTDVAHRAIPTSTSPPLHDMGVYNDWSLRYDGVNAVWRASATNRLWNKCDPRLYLDLIKASDKAYEAFANQGLMHPGDGISDPRALAMACKSFGLTIGFVFEDDPSVIVWPVGTPPLAISPSAIVRCNFTDAIGRQFSATRVSDHDESHLGQALGSTKELAIASKQSTVAIQREALTFFHLPAELRIQVYENLERMWDGGKRLKYVHLPSICSASRQLRNEALPVLIRSRSVSVEIREHYVQGSAQKRKDRESQRARFLSCNVFTKHNRCLALPSAAHLKEITFQVPQETRCLRKTVTLKLLSRAPGFELLIPEGSLQLRQLSMVESTKLNAVFRELVRTVVQDRTTEGLSVFDVGVIADVLFVHNVTKRR